MMARQGQVALARAMENGNTSSKRGPGRDRMRLLSAVEHLPSAQANISGNCLAGFHFTRLAISESCTACGTCGRACPTEALKFEKNEEQMTFTITFSAQRCIGCDLCSHVCQPDSITFDRVPTLEQVFGVKEPVVLDSGTLVRCERCKTLMAKREGVKLCQLCEYRRKHPFGSMMPKKLVKDPVHDRRGHEVHA